MQVQVQVQVQMQMQVQVQVQVQVLTQVEGGEEAYEVDCSQHGVEGGEEQAQVW